MSLDHWYNNHPAEPSRLYCSWLLPRIHTWGTVSLIFYWVFYTQNGLGVNSISLLGYHILGMVGFSLIANQEAVLSFASPLFGSESSRDLWRFVHIITAVFFCK